MFQRTQRHWPPSRSTTVAVSGIIEIDKRRQSVLGSHVEHRVFLDLMLPSAVAHRHVGELGRDAAWCLKLGQCAVPCSDRG